MLSQQETISQFDLWIIKSEERDRRYRHKPEKDIEPDGMKRLEDDRWRKKTREKKNLENSLNYLHRQHLRVEL